MGANRLSAILSAPEEGFAQTGYRGLPKDLKEQALLYADHADRLGLLDAAPDERAVLFFAPHGTPKGKRLRIWVRAHRHEICEEYNQTQLSCFHTHEPGADMTPTRNPAIAALDRRAVMTRRETAIGHSGWAPPGFWHADTAIRRMFEHHGFSPDDLVRAMGGFDAIRLGPSRGVDTGSPKAGARRPAARIVRKATDASRKDREIAPAATIPANLPRVVLGIGFNRLDKTTVHLSGDVEFTTGEARTLRLRGVHLPETTVNACLRRHVGLLVRHEMFEGLDDAIVRDVTTDGEDTIVTLGWGRGFLGNTP